VPGELGRVKWGSLALIAAETLPSNAVALHYILFMVPSRTTMIMGEGYYVLCTDVLLADGDLLRPPMLLLRPPTILLRPPTFLLRPLKTGNFSSYATVARIMAEIFNA
jgi:hypothetical protein